MSHKPMVKTLFSVTGLVILGKLLGFVKQLIIASAFGATLETDLINLSQGLFIDLQALFSQALLTALVVVYLRVQEDGDERARRFAGNVWSAVSVFAVVLSLLLCLCAPLLAKLLAPEYDVDLLARLTRYLRLFAPTMLPFIWATVYNSLLNANKCFIPGEFISISFSFWTISFVLLLPRSLGVLPLALTFLVYTVWIALYLGVLSQRYLTLSRENPVRDCAVRQLLRMMTPLTLSYSLTFLRAQLMNVLSSSQGDGAVSALNYALILSSLVTTFLVTFASIFFPYVTSCISEGNETGAARLTRSAVMALLALFLPIAILTALCAKDIVTIVYARGAFDAQSVTLCTAALVGFAPAFVPLVFQEIYSRYLYAHGDSRHPLINNAIGMTCGIVTSVVLSRSLGLVGITAGSSVISAFVCGGLHWRSARKYYPVLCTENRLSDLVWLLTGGAVCAASACVCLRIFAGLAPFPRFVLTVLISFTAYAFASCPLLLRLARDLCGDDGDKSAASV